MKQLIEKCRKAIAENRCLGCTALENENFAGNSDCEYSKTRTAEESIMQIKLNLRNGEKMSDEKIIELWKQGRSVERIARNFLSILAGHRKEPSWQMINRVETVILNYQK